MKLEIVSGPNAGHEFELPSGSGVTMGRDDTCEVCLNDPKISRRHAQLSLVDGFVCLEDMGSANGLKVNNQRGFRFLLSDGDRIAIGGTVLRVSGLPAERARAQPPPDLRDTPARVRMDDSTETVVLHRMANDEANLLGRHVPPDLVQELRVENRHLRTVGEISRVLAAPHTPQTALQAVMALLRDALDADTVCLISKENDDGEWFVRAMAVGVQSAAAPAQISRTIVKQALDEGVAIIARNPLTDGRFQGSRSILIEGVSSALCSPIRVNNVFCAVLLVDRRHRSEMFTERDLRFTVTVGNLLGMLLDKEQAETEARQRERLATIGEVVANLAHHAKNILASLRFGMNTLGIALQRGETGKLPQYVAMLESQQARLSELVLNMLSYSKERTPARRQVRLAGLIDEVVLPLRDRMAELGVNLVTTCEPPDLEVWAEEAALHRAFLNLVVNALDALQERGDGDKALQIRAVRDGDRAEIRFRDTGCGIPAEARPRIFDVFFSTKGANGTGLGLAVVKKIVEEHAGEISVTSEPGAWTEFTVRLRTHAPAEAGSGT